MILFGTKIVCRLGIELELQLAMLNTCCSLFIFKLLIGFTHSGFTFTCVVIEMQALIIKELACLVSDIGSLRISVSCNTHMV